MASDGQRWRFLWKGRRGPAKNRPGRGAGGRGCRAVRPEKLRRNPRDAQLPFVSPLHTGRLRLRSISPRSSPASSASSSSSTPSSDWRSLPISPSLRPRPRLESSDVSFSSSSPRPRPHQPGTQLQPDVLPLLTDFLQHTTVSSSRLRCGDSHDTPEWRAPRSGGSSGCPPALHAAGPSRRRKSANATLFP